MLAQAITEYEAMPDEVAERVHLVALPMDDVQENAAIVNALQRRADVAVQKSLAEGFGLTVAEAMWKARPIGVATSAGFRPLLPLSVCGTHAVGLHAGRDLHSCCDATPPLLAKRRGLRGNRARIDPRASRFPANERAEAEVGGAGQ